MNETIIRILQLLNFHACTDDGSDKFPTYMTKWVSPIGDKMESYTIFEEDAFCDGPSSVYIVDVNATDGETFENADYSEAYELSNWIFTHTS